MDMGNKRLPWNLKIVKVSRSTRAVADAVTERHSAAAFLIDVGVRSRQPMGYLHYRLDRYASPSHLFR